MIVASGGSPDQSSKKSSAPLEIMGHRIDEKSTLGLIVAKRHWTQRRLFAFIDQPASQLFLVSLLFISLFIADAWTLGNQPDSNNDALYGVLTAIFVIFSIECLSLCYSQKQYVTSIFFLLDLLGTFSIILDIGWIASSFISFGAQSNGAILRSTRAAKLGARYGRLMRILKLTRFLRHLPCFSAAEEVPEPAISHVRKVTTTLISRLSQHFAGVLMIAVIVVPFMSYSPSEESPAAWEQSLKLAAKNPSMTWTDLDKAVNKMHGFYRSNLPQLLSVDIVKPSFDPSNRRSWSWKTRDVLRESNVVIYGSSFKSKTMLAGAKVRILMDMTAANQQDSMLGILLVIMVIILLVGTASSLQFNVDRMVVEPLEKMTDKLMRFATDMLKEWKASMPKPDPASSSPGGAEQGQDDDEDDDLEDVMLEKMIEKIGRIVELRSDKHNSIELSAHEAAAAGLDSHTIDTLKKTFTNNGQTVHNEYTLETVDDNTDEVLRLEKLNLSFTTVDPAVLNSWNFDVLDYSHEQLIETFAYMFDFLNVFDQFRLPRPVFIAFMKELSARYVNANTYHNFSHGCDVAHTVYRLIYVPSLHLAFSHLEVFSILTAALAHDVGHPGLNNVYLVKAKHSLALQHNDKSPLENMHCVQLYDILSKSETNIFVGLVETQWREARKIILRAILATDMAHHFECIKETKMFGEIHGDNIKQFCQGTVSTIDALSEEKNRHFLLDLCLHCADISNPYKAWKICERWADLVIEEFCLQGDREKREGLEISPMCDRASMNLCNSQLGFIDFVVSPLVIGESPVVLLHALFFLFILHSVQSVSPPRPLPPHTHTQPSCKYFPLCSRLAKTWRATLSTGASAKSSTLRPTPTSSPRTIRPRRPRWTTRSRPLRKSLRLRQRCAPSTQPAPPRRSTRRLLLLLPPPSRPGRGPCGA